MLIYPLISLVGKAWLHLSEQETRMHLITSFVRELLHYCRF